MIRNLCFKNNFQIEFSVLTLDTKDKAEITKQTILASEFNANTGIDVDSKKVTIES